MKKNVLIATALLFAPGAALAHDLPGIAVDASDLDLATAAGQARLDTRIDSAIRSACRAGDRSIASRRVERECAASIRTAASAQARIAIAEAREKRFAMIEVNPGA